MWLIIIPNFVSAPYFYFNDLTNIPNIVLAVDGMNKIVGVIVQYLSLEALTVLDCRTFL